MEHTRDRAALDETVTVAELIRRGPQASDTNASAAELCDPGTTKQPRGGLVVLTVLGVLLLISAAGAGALIMAKPAQLARPAHSAAPISGALALRPDLVLNAAWPFAGNGGFADTTGTDAAVFDADPDDAQLANPAAGSESTTLGLVEEFYRRAQDSPERLGGLLTPELGHADELRRAWEPVTEVRITELRVEPDGSVRAQVEAKYPDDRRVLLDQHLHVSPGPLPRISGAELRAARQLPPG